MAYTVIIAEKPAVAGEIAKIVGAREQHREKINGYLEGNGYRVTWAFGHLVGLLSPEEMGFEAGVIPMFPDQWKTKILGKRDKEGKPCVDPVVSKQMKILETLFKGADKIIVATDAGREGELIFRYIYEYFGCKTPFDRLWISSLTEEAIEKGLNEIKDGNEYQALSDAAHARSEADWLVGFNASRALRIATGFKGNLSLGRVQTPTHAMICERYEANKNFVPTPFWQIKVDTEKSSTAFSVLSDLHYSTKEEGESALVNVKRAKQLKVENVEQKQSKAKPPLLYDLTEIQRAANAKFGYTAEETLDIIQDLYVSKYVTYPRTGSRYIPEDVFKTIPDLLKKVSGYGEIGKHAAALSGKKLCKRSVDDSKVTDHHALLPTGVIPTGLKDKEEKIYTLICGRMIEAFGEDYIADVTTVKLSAGETTFTAKGSVPVFMGWKAVFGGEISEEKKGDDEDNENAKLPKMAVNDLLPINAAENVMKTDKPLPIFTENSLLEMMKTCGKKIDDEELRDAMKDVGIGTPATRAAIIEGLVKKTYIERKGKKLVPTPLGMQIYNFVKGRKIAEVMTTGEWERDLAQVERGTRDVAVFNKGIHQFVLDIIEDLGANCKPLDGVNLSTEPERTCPCCGAKMKNMKFNVLCSEEKGGCGLKIPREVCGKKLSASQINALAQGKETAEIKGFKSQAGKVFNAALKVNKETKKVEFVFSSGSAAPRMDTSAMKCPLCGGDIKDEGGKLACTECSFVLWKTQGDVKLSEKQLKELMSGKKVLVSGMKNKEGKKYSAKLYINTTTGKIEREFDNNKKKK